MYRDERGAALPAVLMVLLVVALLGGGAITYASKGADGAETMQASQTAQENAENGLEAAKYQISQDAYAAHYDGVGRGDVVWAEKRGGKKLRFRNDAPGTFAVVKIKPGAEAGQFEVNSVGHHDGTRRSLDALVDAAPADAAPADAPPGSGTGAPGGNPGGGTTTPGTPPPAEPPPAEPPPPDAPGNQAPVGAADKSVTKQGAPVSIPVLDNDEDPDPGDRISLTANTRPAHGTVACARGQARCSYTPARSFVGDDSFSYDIEDSRGGTDKKIPVTVTVNAPAGQENRGPLALDDGPAGAYTMKEDAPERRLNVMINDRDPDGDPIRVTTRTKAQHGAAKCYPSYCTYRASKNYSGSDSFSYTIEDTSGESAKATVRLKVTPVAEPPAPKPDPKPSPKPGGSGCGGNSGQSGTSTTEGNGGSSYQDFRQKTSCTTSGGPNGTTTTMSCDQAARQQANGGTVSLKIRQECNLGGKSPDGKPSCKQVQEMSASGKNVSQEARQRCGLGGKR